MNRLILIMIAILLGACSPIPETIRNAPTPDIQLPDVQKDFSAYQGKLVRWGGALIEVENRETGTTLQIMAYPLNDNGHPDVTAVAQGRFIVRANEFLDPALYTRYSEITAFGRLIDQSERHVGRKSLKLPVIELLELHLWPGYSRRSCGYAPYYGNYCFGDCSSE